MPFEMEQFKTEGFELFISSWNERLASTGIHQELPSQKHEFWRTLRPRSTVDLSKHSALLQGVSLARYDTYLVLTALLYTNSLFESKDLIIGHNLPGHFFNDANPAQQRFSRELLDSLNLNQPLCLIDEYFENFEINTICYEQLRKAVPTWHDAFHELEAVTNFTSAPRSASQLPSSLLYFIPQLFSEKQIIEQCNHLSALY
ncbi:hypothetical protein EAG18_15285 [Pseudoalteromonas sp. J010]|uniref:hypothetical protein n=1 Tax=Pseudoalteromonas sp. J010 TaxID=998465 RepID=UPI000F6456B4|nr:hypothetical protein [Pseudoalteromonas sp. J010]RRS07812.1 hypothetical protein EAG18_15285 [Pseudoalteromonas sp. J010]